MSKIISGWYDFFKCPSCKKDFAIKNEDNQEEDYLHFCGTYFDGDDYLIGREMIETE
jgi:hypothetical protein